MNNLTVLNVMGGYFVVNTSVSLANPVKIKGDLITEEKYWLTMEEQGNRTFLFVTEVMSGRYLDE